MIRLTHQGQIATVCLTGEGAYNPLSVAHWKGLTQAFNDVLQIRGIRVVVIRGEGGNFAAGADITEFATQRSNRELGTHYHELIVYSALEAIFSCPIPTLAIIEGVCVGGGLEIAASCDCRIASQSSRFGIPINRLGFPLAHRELQMLLGWLGPAVALEILLEGRIWDSSEALQKGLVGRVVPDVDIEMEGYRMAERIAAGSPQTARANKRWVRRFMQNPAPLTQEELYEHYAFFESGDYHEGMRAFLAKEKPCFADPLPTSDKDTKVHQ